MSSTRTASRTTTTMNKPTSTLNAHHTNGSANTYETNDSSNTSEFDSNLPRSILTKNISQMDGIYRNPRFVHALTIGLLGQPVVIQTNEQQRYHGILETVSPNGDVLLSVAHRIDNNNDIMSLSTSLIDLFDTVDSSVQSFELQKRVIQASNIVEIIAMDIDLSNNGKFMLDETPKINQLEDDRFNRMEHFYGSEEIDPETLEELDLGDDGKAGYDPEDMFHTNREKFNTTTDFDESKYTNVPLRQLTVDELAEIDKKALEIEKGTRSEDVDEDDAGVKRPSEYNQTHHIDDGNSNMKTNQSSRIHSSGDRRPDFRPDSDYNSSKRGSWRDQRPGGGNNRRGGQNNYSMNNSKQNQRAEQTQYTSSRSSEQSTNNRQQQYKSRNNNRYTENLPPHEGRDSPSQITNDETTRGQRINSGSFSQGQNSGPTSPSTTAPGRSGYPRNSGPPIGRNSPAPYTGSSSSRNNSTTATSSPPPTSTTYPNNPTGTGNYSQQANNNKMNKKQSRNEQSSVNDELDQPKQQRNQQQNSSNNQSNTVPPVRPSHLQPQQIKQPPQSQQTPSTNTTIPPPLALPSQDDHSSSHESNNPNQSESTIHLTNAPLYTQHPAGTTTPGNPKANLSLNPEADEFVPVFTRESNSRPESRGVPTSSMPIAPFIQHTHPQALHLLQQQQQQQQQAQQTQAQQSSMIPSTHPQNTPPIYQPYYQPQFSNMPQFVNATPQQMSMGMIGTTMMPPQAQQQQLTGNGPTTNMTNNPNTGGMTTPNGGAGPGYKPNNNPAHSGDTGNSSVSNTASKKAVVSVRAEQSNVPQQQQVTGASQMVYPTGPVRFYSPDYVAQSATTSSMQLQPIPFYYPLNTSGIIQATPAGGVGPPQNMMITSAGSSAGQVASGPPSLYYQYPDPRIYTMYSAATSVNPSGVNQNWQMTRSPPHQQQQPQPTDQQRAYGGGQNMVSQAPPPSGAPNANSGGGRSASTSGPSGQTGAPPMTPQYALNGSVPTAYAYGPPPTWYSAQTQVSSPQTSMPPQVNAYGMMFDPSQQPLPQQPTYVHQNLYDAAYFQQAQQQPPQQGLDTVPTGNYNR